MVVVFQEMLQKTRADKSGVALEVNERILDSCTELMQVSARLLQGRLVLDGVWPPRKARMALHPL